MQNWWIKNYEKPEKLLSKTTSGWDESFGFVKLNADVGGVKNI